MASNAERNSFSFSVVYRSFDRCTNAVVSPRVLHPTRLCWLSRTPASRGFGDSCSVYTMTGRSPVPAARLRRSGTRECRGDGTSTARGNDPRGPVRNDGIRKRRGEICKGCRWDIECGLWTEVSHIPRVRACLSGIKTLLACQPAPSPPVVTATSTESRTPGRAA